MKTEKISQVQQVKELEENKESSLVTTTDLLCIAC
jgi:hypothetical protein